MAICSGAVFSEPPLFSLDPGAAHAARRDLAIPALVIAGRTSHPSLRAVARRLAAGLPGARLVEIEDCGHVTYAEQPDAFADAVSVFVAELDRRVPPRRPDT
jgi:pimeloyl-ACP methyl ester carboxylesterase